MHPDIVRRHSSNISCIVDASVHKRTRGDDGSFFLFPQSQYFMNNVNKTMYVFCTKCLTVQWSAFAYNSSISMHMQRKKEARSEYAMKSKLSDEQSALIRHLFPQDAMLLRKYCTSC